MKIDNIKNEIELAFENTKEASYKEIYNFFGLTVENIIKKTKSLIKS